MRNAIVVLVVQDEAGRYLLEERTDNQSFSGTLMMPGGNVESDELPMEAAHRECAEELGLHDCEFEFLRVVTGFSTKSAYVYKLIAYSGIIPNFVLDTGAQLFWYRPDEVELDIRVLSAMGIHKEIWMDGDHIEYDGASKRKLLNGPDYGPEYILLVDKGDFFWYKKELDLSIRHELRHLGEPEQLPCFVHSEYQSEECVPDYWKHTFIYRHENICSNCGHRTMSWPKLQQQDE